MLSVAPPLARPASVTISTRLLYALLLAFYLPDLLKLYAPQLDPSLGEWERLLPAFLGLFENSGVAKLLKCPVGLHQPLESQKQVRRFYAPLCELVQDEVPGGPDPFWWERV